MKTSYYLVTAAVVAAAAVTVYAQLPPPSAPSLPQVTLPPVSVTPEVPAPSLPPVVPVSQEVPVAPQPKPVTPAPQPVVPPPASIPAIPAPSLPPIPTPSVTPPAIPAPPVLPPVTTPTVPAPSLPPVQTPPNPNLTFKQPMIDLPPVEVTNQVPQVVPAPRAVVTPAPVPVVPPPVEIAPPVVKPTVPPPAALPAPTPVAEKPTGPAKYLVTADGKLVEGVITKSATGYVVRRGSLDQPYKQDDVLFVGHTKDEVYQHLVGRLDAKDVEKRVQLAQWCAFNGMRAQGLVEAKVIVGLQPTNTTAANLVRTLEASLKQYPESWTPGTALTPAAAPAPPLIPAAASEPEIDVTPDGAMSFASKAHTLLVNLCADCHAKPTYAGTFKMARSSSYDTTPATVRQNLRAVAVQLNKTDVAASPLLTKAVTPHGGLKEPRISSRQGAAFRNLEAWAAVAVGADVLLPRTTQSPTVVPVAAPTPPAVLPTAGTFGAEAKPDPKPTGPSPTNPGNPVDEFDPSVFNKATRPK